MRYFFLATLFVIFKLNFAFSQTTKEFLDEYEDLVIVYEQLSEKDPLCTEDLTKVSLELMPKLSSFSQKATNMQASFSGDDLERYIEITQKFQNSMMKLSPKMQNVTC